MARVIERKDIRERCLSCVGFLDCLLYYLKNPNWFWPDDCRLYEKGDWTAGVFRKVEE